LSEGGAPLVWADDGLSRGKEGVTLEMLEKIAMQKDDNQCAQEMQDAKYRLFKTFHIDLPFSAAR